MSANIGAKDIVTDGLVLYLDAANYKSYTSGSTTWTDLTINKLNATLVNNPAYSTGSVKSLIYAGSTWGYINSNEVIQSLTNNFTALCWINPTTPFAGARLFGPGYIGFWQFEFRGGSGTRMSINYNNSGSNIFQSNGPYIGFNSWQQVGFLIDNSEVKFIQNGSIGSTNFTVAGSFKPTNAVYSVGNYNGGTDGAYYGEIASHTVYNRVLTSAEVLQNYNALKVRFGL